MIDFRIKICGVRTAETVVACAAAGADAIGLNFYPKSVRYVEPESSLTRTIRARAKQDSLACVGLFVNAPLENIRRISDSLSLDAVQLHGDERPELAEQLLRTGVGVLRAVRLPTTPLSPQEIQNLIGRWADLPLTLLLDADAGSQFGGSGQQLDWLSIAAWAKKRAKNSPDLPWILAGGLTDQNVALARQRSGAERVDVASGVESSPGAKSAELIQKFVRACKPRGVDVER